MTALTERRILGIRCNGARPGAAHGVGPRHRGRTRPRVRRGRPGRHRRIVDLGARPVEQHPLRHPFAFALIRLDGASTPLLHAVDAGSPDEDDRGAAGGPPLARRPARPDRRHRLLRARRDGRDRRGRRRAGHRAGATHGLPGLDHLPEPRARGDRPGRRRLPGAPAAGSALPHVCDGSTPEGGATAPSTPSSSGPSARSICPTRARSPTSPSSPRCSTRARRRRSPSCGPSSSSTAPTSSSPTRR